MPAGWPAGPEWVLYCVVPFTTVRRYPQFPHIYWNHSAIPFVGLILQFPSWLPNDYHGMYVSLFSGYISSLLFIHHHQQNLNSRKHGSCCWIEIDGIRFSVRSLIPFLDKIICITIYKFRKILLRTDWITLYTQIHNDMPKWIIKTLSLY